MYKKPWLYLILSVLGLLVSMSIGLVSAPNLSSFGLVNSATGEQVEIKQLPIEAQLTPGNYTLTMDWNYAPYISQTGIKFTTNECLNSLKVNNNPINLDNSNIFGPDTRNINKDTQGTYCGYGANTLNIDLASYLKPGHNRVEFNLQYNQPNAVITMAPAPLGLNYWLIFILCNVWLYAVLYCIFGRLGLTFVNWLVLCGGIMVYQLKLSVNEFHYQAHDLMGTGHWGYIKYIYNNWSWPALTDGWQYYSPPLYYYLAGGFYWLSQISRIASYFPQLIIQYLSILIAAITLIYGYLTTALTVKHNSSRWLINLLITFAPGTIMYSTRVSNDVLYYMFFSIGLYHLMKWWQNGRNLNYILAVISAGLCVNSKTNGIILLLILLMCLIAKTIQTKKIFLPLWLSAMPIVSIALLVNFWRVIELNWLGQSTNLVVGNITSLNPLLKVDNHWHNYVFFDVGHFLASPFTNTWSDTAGRQWFWEFFIKSSLYSEMDYNHIGSLVTLGQAINLTWLVLLLVCLYNIARSVKSLWLVFPLVLTVFLSLGFIITYRINHSFAPNQDFRFVYPMLLPLIIIGRPQSFSWIYQLWRACIYVIAGLSFVYLFQFLGI